MLNSTYYYLYDINIHYNVMDKKLCNVIMAVNKKVGWTYGIYRWNYRENFAS